MKAPFSFFKSHSKRDSHQESKLSGIVLRHMGEPEKKDRVSFDSVDKQAVMSLKRKLASVKR